MLIQSIRNFISSDLFPFQQAWDLNSKDLLFYLTMDQVLDNKWQIEPNMLNEVADESYVLANIIRDKEGIGFLSKSTQMRAGGYCFVSPKKVIEYVKDKV